MSVYDTPAARFIFCAVLAASLAFSGCSDRRAAAADDAALAQAQFDAGNLQEARESIQRAIIARDDLPDYFVLLAQIELASGQATGAFNAYSRALDLQADNMEILQNIAELGLQTDRVQEADEAADRMLLLSPGSSSALMVKGFVAIEQGRFADAKRYTDDILKLNPNDRGGIILSARLHAIEGNFEDAVAIIQRGLSLSSAGDGALNATLLEIYRAQANVAGLRKVFPLVVSATQPASDYEVDYINFLYKTGDVEAARRQAIAALDRRLNDPDTLAALARIFLEYDQHPISQARLAAIAAGGSMATQLALGRFYLDTLQLDTALHIIARPLSEGAPEAQALASRIMLAQGKGAEAERLAALVVASDPRNPDALLTRSAIRSAKGQLDGAIEDANIVVSDAPQEYAGHVALAKAQLAKGSALRARQVFERGVGVLPQSALLAGAYAEFLRSVGDSARIMSLHAGLAAANPSSLAAARAYVKVSQEFRDEMRQADAERAVRLAARSYAIDLPPGTPKNRGIFSRITSEQICKATGGVCTAS